MILALDIGNTNMEIGIIPEKKGEFSVIASCRYYTKLDITSDQLAIFILSFLDSKKINPNNIKKMIFSSVVPPLNNLVIKMYESHFKGNIIEVSNKINLGIKNCYKNPEEVGGDRLVAATAAYHLYKKNAIIIDMGTATTACVITKTGDYLGGVILPGISTATKALTKKAAKLPSVKIQKKDKLLAEDTSSAIESGVYFSNYYALKGIISKLREEINFNDCVVVATGGYSNIFSDDGLFDIIEPLLTLKGLKIISDLY